MTRQEILHAIGVEIKKERRKNKTFPDHIVAQTATVSAAAGLLNARALNIKFHTKTASGKLKQRNYLKKNAVAVIVQAVRLLENLK